MSLIVTFPFGNTAVRENGEVWATTGRPSYFVPLSPRLTLSAMTWPTKSRMGVSS